MTAEHTVEAVVRHQLAKAMGGIRGMLEAAVPTLAFTAVFLTTRHLPWAIGVSVAAAVILLVIRIAQRSSPQFVLNAFVGIAIGAFFAWRAARAGGSANDQALAYFLPGIVMNAAYAILMIFSILTRHPVLGYLVGSVAHNPMHWRDDPAMVALCSRLTWVMALPLLTRAGVLGSLYLAGTHRWIDPATAITALGVAKLLLGWPLLVAGLVLMIWMLTRDKIPVTDQTVGVEPDPV